MSFGICPVYRIRKPYDITVHADNKIFFRLSAAPVRLFLYGRQIILSEDLAEQRFFVSRDAENTKLAHPGFIHRHKRRRTSEFIERGIIGVGGGFFFFAPCSRYRPDQLLQRSGPGIYDGGRPPA